MHLPKHPMCTAQTGPDNAALSYGAVLSLKRLFWKPFWPQNPDPAHLIITPQRWRVLERRSQQLKSREEARDAAGTEGGNRLERWRREGGSDSGGDQRGRRTDGRADGGPQVQAANPHLGSHMMAALRNVSQTEAQTEWERKTGRLEETETKTIALPRNPGTKGGEAGRDYVKPARVFKYLPRRHALTPAMMTFQYLNTYKSGRECRKRLFLFLLEAEAAVLEG